MEEQAARCRSKSWRFKSRPLLKCPWARHSTRLTGAGSALHGGSKPPVNACVCVTREKGLHTVSPAHLLKYRIMAVREDDEPCMHIRLIISFKWTFPSCAVCRLFLPGGDGQLRLLPPPPSQPQHGSSQPPAGLLRQGKRRRRHGQCADSRPVRLREPGLWTSRKRVWPRCSRQVPLRVQSLASQDVHLWSDGVKNQLRLTPCLCKKKKKSVSFRVTVGFNIGQRVLKMTKSITAKISVLECPQFSLLKHQKNDEIQLFYNLHPSFFNTCFFLTYYLVIYLCHVWPDRLNQSTGRMWSIYVYKYTSTLLPCCYQNNVFYVPVHL